MTESLLDSVPLIEIEVSFDPTLDPPLRVNQEEVFMPPGLGLLQFHLSGDASFLTHPVQWMQNEFALKDAPPFMSVARLGPQTVVVTSDNRSPKGQAKRYVYMLLAFCAGRVVTTDPTIINLPTEPG